MIIDGVEVLYRMRNGKIVDPNIPVDGLVCYLDTRGKCNTDVYRNTLLDLSGNGNHGMLQNFSFTEESGYVKDLSEGLQFDGVDDQVTFNDPIPLKGKRTCYIEFEINKPASDQGGIVEIGGNMYIHNADNRIYFSGVPVFTFKTFVAGEYKITYTQGEDNSNPRFWVDGLENPSSPIVTGADPFPQTIGRRGKKFIKKLMIWNRVLTEQEIQQLMEG